MTGDDETTSGEGEAPGELDEWAPRPLPKLTPETRPFWEGAADGRLLLNRCRECGLTYYYPRAICPDCFGDETDWIESSGEGSVYSYSATERVAGWPQEALPLVVAYVELDEGPRVLTNLVGCEPADVEIGAEVAVRFVPSGGDDEENGEEDGEEDDEELAVPVFELV